MRKFKRLLILFAGSALLASFLSRPACASEEDLLYRTLAPQTYEVRIWVQWGNSLQLPASAREQVLQDLRRLLKRSVGSFWSVNIEQHGPSPNPDRQFLRERSAPLEYQIARKTYLAVIHRQGGNWLLQVCEGDHTTAQWSAVWDEEVDDARLIAPTLHGMIGRVFQPLYRITGIERDTIRLIAVGGEWTVVQAPFDVVPAGGLARPVIIYRDRENAIQQIQLLPLTYLSLSDRDRARVTSRLISAYAAPLGSGRKKRVELWALGGTPLRQRTQMTLKLRGRSSRVLMGHRVVVQPKRFVRDEADAEPIELLSDRHGRLEIETVEGFPVVWLYVWSGEALLARVPYVPGWNESETLELPDDSVRLRVEGELDRLRTDLVADVSRRAINRILLLKAAKQGDRDEVDRLREVRLSLPTEQTYQKRLERIETGGVEDAEQAGNRVAAARIRRSCDEMQKVVFRFLDPARDRDLQSEVDALLKLERIEPSNVKAE